MDDETSGFPVDGERWSFGAGYTNTTGPVAVTVVLKGPGMDDLVLTAEEALDFCAPPGYTSMTPTFTVVG